MWRMVLIVSMTCGGDSIPMVRLRPPCWARIGLPSGYRLRPKIGNFARSQGRLPVP